MLNKRFIIIAAACAVCAALACGCSSSAQKSEQAESSGDMQAPAAETSAAVAEETSAETSAAPEEPAYQVFGTQDAEGAAFELMNKLDQPIISLAVKTPADGGYPASLIPEDAQMVAGEIAIVYLPKIEGAVSEDSDIQTKAVADVLVVLADGTEYELHQVDVYDIADGAVRLEDGVAYLEYTSNATGEPVSTLEAELAWREAQTAADESAGDGTENAGGEEYYYEEPTYYEDTTYYEAPAGGGEDQCVPDIILR